MQTEFSPAQLSNLDIASSNEILRKCVHCGFCIATCPTYLLLGDELDSPRGRIYLIKDMLETGRPADAKTVLHIDRCLSCLSCMTTCPSSVHYMHLVDHARAYIEETYRRPLPDRLLRAILALVLPRPKLFRLALWGAKIGAPLIALLPSALVPERIKGLLAMAPKVIAPPSPVDKPQVHRATSYSAPPDGEDREPPIMPRKRVALLNGCAQKVLDPNINEATIRLLNRHGVDVVVAKGAGCCGALAHHMGHKDAAHAAAAHNIRAWCDEMNRGGLDHVIINTSGCGTTVKDYGFMFRDDADLADKAAKISAIALDITEFMQKIGLSGQVAVPKLKVAYHSACSMQHGQKITKAPVELLTKAGFEVLPVPESHLCCGSAGTYNLLQPKIATQLRDRKIANLEAVGAQIIAAGNLGCMVQIEGGSKLPVVHTVELLDWATGGPCPKILAALIARNDISTPGDASSGTSSKPPLEPRDFLETAAPLRRLEFKGDR